MKKDEEYFQKLLQTWEETYKKGQFTLWLLLSLKNKPRYMTEIRDFIIEQTKGNITCEEQSVYRALRKFYDLEIVDYEMREGNSGPSRKYYFLTEIGKALLSTFIRRNIVPMYEKEISTLLLAEE